MMGFVHRQIKPSASGPATALPCFRRQTPPLSSCGWATAAQPPAQQQQKALPRSTMLRLSSRGAWASAALQPSAQQGLQPCQLHTPHVMTHSVELVPAHAAARTAGKPIRCVCRRRLTEDGTAEAGLLPPVPNSNSPPAAMAAKPSSADPTAARAAEGPDAVTAVVGETLPVSGIAGASRPVMIIMVGVPGSGKSTWTGTLQTQSRLPWQRVNQVLRDYEEALQQP